MATGFCFDRDFASFFYFSYTKWEGKKSSYRGANRNCWEFATFAEKLETVVCNKLMIVVWHKVRKKTVLLIELFLETGKSDSEFHPKCPLST